MTVPPLTPDGVLPPSPDGEPYAAYPSDVEALFVTDDQREAIWARFCALRELAEQAGGGPLVTPLTWWIWRRFITSAPDVDQIDVVLFVPPTTPPAFGTLSGMLRSGSARDLMTCTIVVLTAGDVEARDLYRRRCSKNTPIDQGESFDAGWVELL